MVSLSETCLGPPTLHFLFNPTAASNDQLASTTAEALVALEATMLCPYTDDRTKLTDVIDGGLNALHAMAAAVARCE